MNKDASDASTPLPTVPSSWITLKKMEGTKSHHSNVKVKSLSRVRLCVTLWTVAYQTPPSMGFSRQEYWSGLPFPSPGDLPEPGIETKSPELQADALPSEPPGKPIQTYTCPMNKNCCNQAGPMGPSSDRHPALHPHPASCV